MSSNADEIQEIVPERPPPPPKRSSLVKRAAPEPPSARVFKKIPGKLTPTDRPEKPQAPFHPFDNLNDDDCEVTFQEINLDDVSDEISKNTQTDQNAQKDQNDQKRKISENETLDDDKISLPDSTLNSNLNFNLKSRSSRSSTLINEQPPPPNFNPTPDNFKPEAVIQKSTKLAPIHRCYIDVSGKSFWL